ncbi:monovalent cation:proton antiporter-2 (CPA2) family protein [Chiayiivirga flava]|uniref:Glutathione-regulated potassium-efflux system protein KefB n=1 Tax=Chiayiivirga flava TaxID=659595 RepID=A0A7W8FZB8_9GAMM|nr:monovalent cation:proton antiporter-2 (CPA2) family protein [Chiayiivirga flava]MBB5207981.1 glutathione-regulated potassium-efflux system protein KefB [Chiayiivirga flava]
MSDHGTLELALVFLLAAVIAVPLFRRLGLGAVLGYLAAGVVLGPDVLRVVSNADSVLAASELGVVMLLFVIGLELSPARLWVMRRQVFGMGGLQVLLSALLLGVCGLLYGLGWKANLVIGLGLALSSTAVGLQLLAERKELTTGYGRLAFAILLFQDLVAIPLLALIPILGEAKALEQAAPSPAALAKAFAVILAVVVGGRYLLRPVLRWVARVRMVEVFTATALLVVAGNAWLMDQAGLSMGLGAFLAGVLLADSEYRHALEAHIEPFKGLLLGLFFMAVGMSIDLDRVMDEPGIVALWVAGLLALKMLVLVGVGRAARLDTRNALLLGTVLGLGGEFAFVVFGEAFKEGLIDAALRDRLLAVVALTMAVTPLCLLAVDRLLGGRREASTRERRAFDTIRVDAPRVIVAGFGRMGQIVARMLRAQKITFVALENSPEQVDLSRRFGSTLYFGDPASVELLRSAGAEHAEIFVLTTDDPDANIRIARMVKRSFPHLRIYARARNRQHVFKLMDLDVNVVRETFHSSLELGERVLCALGLSPEDARLRRERFEEHDERLLHDQHLIYDDEAALIASNKEALRELEHLFDADELSAAAASAPPRGDTA